MRNNLLANANSRILVKGVSEIFKFNIAPLYKSVKPFNKFL